jgi:hypothetical protein
MTLAKLVVKYISRRRGGLSGSETGRSNAGMR